MKLTICVTVFLIVSGCTLLPPEARIMYQGEKRDIKEVAVISEGARGILNVVSVDGKKLIDPIAGGGRLTKGLHVEPGTRTIEVAYFEPEFLAITMLGTAQSSLTINVKAGHTYMLMASRKQDYVKFWFEDMGENYNQDCLTVNNYVDIAVKHKKVSGC